MRSTITVELDGTSFALTERAFLALHSYLERAGARLGTHPDRSAVLSGLERSIAAELARRGAVPGGVLDEAAVVAALKQVGRVDGPDLGEAETAEPGAGERRRRRLFRLRQGQQIAGVCAGLAAYAEIDVNIVRLLFILGAFFTGGLLLGVYIVLMFVMPVARTDDEIAEAHGGAPPRARITG
jgi:phage shock protein PspC (stress-responsive transcriptional regulator)